MAWVETESISFSARHDETDTATAQRYLDRLEDLRLRLEDRFDVVPGEVGVIVHSSPPWLSLAHPYLPAARWSAAPAGRRYLAGWPMATELHVLNDTWLERRAAGEDSLAALRGTAERLYTQIVVAANNPQLPPPWTPRRFARYMRWAWLVEGAGQYFARQVPLFRAAVLTRLRDGDQPSFPPGRRDAVLLGGTVFDLLERMAGPEACDRLVSRLRKEGPKDNIEFAFDSRLRAVERAWREHLSELGSRAGDLDGELVEPPDQQRRERHRDEDTRQEL